MKTTARCCSGSTSPRVDSRHPRFGASSESLDVLKGLGVNAFSLRGIPPKKLRGYAQRLRSQRPARFAAVAEPRRTLELVGFLRVALLDTTDGIVQLTGRGTLSLVRKARNKSREDGGPT